MFILLVHSSADVTANFNFNSVQNVQKGRTKEPFSRFRAYGNYRLQYRHTYALRRFTTVNMPTHTNEFNTFKLFMMQCI